MHIYKGTTGSLCFILRENDTLSGVKLVRLPCAYLDGNNWARGEIREIVICISRSERNEP